MDDELKQALAPLRKQKGVGARVVNILLDEGIETLPQLLGYSEVELLCFEGFGYGSLKTLKEALAKNNLVLGSSPRPSRGQIEGLAIEIYESPPHGGDNWDRCGAKDWFRDEAVRAWYRAKRQG